MTPRPTTVTAAYWTWLVSAVALLLLGLLSLTISGQAIRDSLSGGGNSDESIDNFLTLLRGFGAISVVVGVVVAVLIGPVCRRGHGAFRRALVALSVVFAIVLLLSTGVGLSAVPLLALAAAVLLLISSALIYRPSSAWF